MRIGIDARLYTQTGVGRYLRNLIAELGDLDKKNEYVIYLRPQEFADFEIPNFRWRKKLADVSWHTVTEQIVMPSLLWKDNLDVAHFPYFNVPLLYSKKYLLTIHDLIVDHFDTGRASTLPYPLYLIKRVGYKASLTLGIKRASAISTISLATKNEVVDHYHVKPDQILVTYDALDIHFTKALKTQKPVRYYEFPYILYVGNAYPHKNLESLLKALSIVQRSKKVKLVLAGDDAYFYPRLKNYARKLNLASEVIFFGNADDCELINLYSFSLCLIFPSLMEGFGLPNLEALACGRLPVVSDIPAFREVWRDRLIFFDPYDVKDIAQKILGVLGLPQKEYQDRVDQAKKRIAYFSWRKTAVETLKLYGKIHNS